MNTEQDGVSVYGHGTFRAPPELLGEINMVALNAPAEYRAATTVVGVGRRGTNRFHGEAYINYVHPRLYALTINELGKPRIPSKPTITSSYEFGGPVYIPKVYDGRNKTFFHFLYQPTSAELPEFPRAIYPTVKMRGGDLSEVLAATGKVITNPFTGQPFPNNIIPDSLISPIAKNILKRVPLPNLGPPGNLGVNFVSLALNKEDNNWWHFRFDHQLLPNNTLSFTNIRFNSEVFQQWELQPLSIQGGSQHTRAVSIQDTHTFSSKLVNEFLFGWNNQASVTVAGIQSGNALLKEFGITDLGGRTPPEELGVPVFNMVTFGSATEQGSAGGNIWGRTVSGNTRAEPRVFTVRDTVSYQVGHHLFKTGLDINWERPKRFTLGTTAWGQWNFTGSMTGHEISDFLLGLPFTTTIAVPRPELAARQVNWGVFVQDDWKVTPKFTLTPGVRFQHYGLPIDANGLYYNFDFAKSRVVVPDEKSLAAVSPAWPKGTIPVVTAAQAGYPKELVNFKALMVEPRLGLAWRLSEKFVARMGYGIYHVPFTVAGGVGQILNGRDVGPLALSESFGPNQIVNGVPQLTLARGLPGAGSGQIPLQTVSGMPVDVRSKAWPYDQQWNVTLERELALGFVGRASYVGSKGTHWPYVRNLNTPSPSTIPFNQRPLSERRPFGPDFANVFLQDLGGNSTFHGIEMELSRQFSRGLYFRTFYERRKSLDDVNNGDYGTTIGREIEDPYNRAREKGTDSQFLLQRGQVTVVYDLPLGRGQRFLSGASGALNHILGNWTVAPVFNAYQGFTQSAVFSGADPANVGKSSGRADLLPGCKPNNFGPTPGILWNSRCFTVPINGRYGTSPRGLLHGPRVWTTDYSMFKKWNLTGKENGPYFKAEVFVRNLFNHRNASSGAAVSNNITSPNFGYFNPDPWDSRKPFIRLRLGW